MIPSITAAIRPSASRFLIGSVEPKRERMSPTWRFSKKASGSRSRWRNRSAVSRRLSVFCTSSRMNERSAVVITESAASRAKPRAKTVSRSASPLTITSSMATCR
jgi:hypothetical protein